MDAENMKDLAIVRYDNAIELLTDAENLLKLNSYRSANNRAFYAVEKALKATLASAGKDAASHNGVVRVFNQEFIHNASETFTREDLSAVQRMERIRNASDYDDFYLASKADCVKQVQQARMIVEKVGAYLKTITVGGEKLNEYSHEGGT